jgi:Na+/proline symporter
MMGICSETMNKEGAIAGMLAGPGITLFYVFAHKRIFFVRGTESVDLIGGPNPFFGITPKAFAPFAALVNLVGGVVVVAVIASVVFGQLDYQTWSAIAGITIWCKVFTDFALSRHAHNFAARKSASTPPKADQRPAQKG